MARSKCTTAQPAARQPAAEGPDVIYNGTDWDAFADGRYVSSRSNNQDAWIEARAAHFDAVEAAPIAPTVRCEAFVCDDVIDTQRHGKVMGTSYFSGQGDDKVEVYFPLLEHNPAPLNRPCVYMLKRDEVPIDEIERVLPNILAVLADPRVQAARAQWSKQQARSGLRRLRRAGVA